MKLEKIYESLGMDKLDEEKQKEIKTYLDETIELKAKEIAVDKIEEEKNELVEKYEQKFEDYKEEITSKFSSFVDDIFEKELEIPEKIKKFARIGEKYEPIIEKLKIMMGIEEGSFDEQAKEIMTEAQDEILSLTDRVNKLTSEKLELVSDAEEMASHIYLRKKCDGLTESKKEKVLRLLDDVKGKEEIDRKFKMVIEEFDFDSKSSNTLNEKMMYCKKCDKDIEVDESEDNAVCPECGGDLSEKKEEKKDVKESKTPDIMETWKQIIRENRF